MSKKPQKQALTNSTLAAIGNDCAGIFIPGCKVHDHGLGLEMGVNTSFLEWSRIAPFMNRFSTAGKWMCGDWLKFGIALFNEDEASQVVQDTGYKFETLMKIVRVCTKVEFVRRRKELSFEHHECVAKLTPEDQTKWLDISVEESLSRREMRASIKADKVVREHEIDKAQRKAKPATIDGLIEYFNRWREEQGLDLMLETVEYNRRCAIRDGLTPIAEFIAKLGSVAAAA